MTQKCSHCEKLATKLYQVRQDQVAYCDAHVGRAELARKEYLIEVGMAALGGQPGAVRFLHNIEPEPPCDVCGEPSTNVIKVPRERARHVCRRHHVGAAVR